MFRVEWFKLVVTAVAIAVGVGLSMHAEVPRSMPAASLGWELLLHLERAVALLALVGAALLIGVRALGGTFPIKLGHIEYARDELGQAELADLADRVTILEDGRGQRHAGTADMIDPNRS